jgi:sortase A
MKNKKFWKYFIPLFLITFVIFNWSEVSWVFNYRAVSGLFSDLFTSSDREIQTSYLPDDFNDVQTDQYQEKAGSIEIPKIAITAPLVFVESSDAKEFEKALDFGVLHFPDSVFPGQAGQTILLGHSAPPGWPKIKYDWVFTDLNDLVKGDEIYVFFNNKKYEYTVTRKAFLEKGEEVSQQGLTNNENMLVLISCWPPGKDIRRIAVEAATK